MGSYEKNSLPYYCIWCGEEFKSPQPLMTHDCPVKMAQQLKKIKKVKWEDD